MREKLAAATIAAVADRPLLGTGTLRGVAVELVI
jgi:hypothetical protein